MANLVVKVNSLMYLNKIVKFTQSLLNALPVSIFGIWWVWLSAIYVDDLARGGGLLLFAKHRENEFVDAISMM